MGRQVLFTQILHNNRNAALLSDIRLSSKMCIETFIHRGFRLVESMEFALTNSLLRFQLHSSIIQESQNYVVGLFFSIYNILACAQTDTDLQGPQTKHALCEQCTRPSFNKAPLQGVP